MTGTAVSAHTPASKTALGFIDCDVHNGTKSAEDLRKYLPARWHDDYFGAGAMPSEHYGTDPKAGKKKSKEGGGIWLGGAGRLSSSMFHASRPTNGAFRWDATPPSGGLPGTDFDFMLEDFMNAWSVEKAILTPRENGGWPQSGPLAGALAGALNDWMIAEWLDRDERMFGCITIPMEDALLAKREIERSASYPRFVQVEMVMKTRDPMGHARYWPIYEAAEAAGLPVSVHVGGGAPNAATSGGWPSYHYEFRNGLVQAAQAQVVSLIGSGVFNAFPDLKVVLVEGGFAWVPALLWRMDRAWRLMGKRTTHLDEPPSEILRKHVWFTTQPLDEPEKASEFMENLGHLDALGVLDNVMFSTDYPHWDFNSPTETFPSVVPLDLKEKIYRHNAEALFHFDERTEKAQ